MTDGIVTAGHITSMLTNISDNAPVAMKGRARWRHQKGNIYPQIVIEFTNGQRFSLHLYEHLTKETRRGRAQHALISGSGEEQAITHDVESQIDRKA